MNTTKNLRDQLFDGSKAIDHMREVIAADLGLLTSAFAGTDLLTPIHPFVFAASQNTSWRVTKYESGKHMITCKYVGHDGRSMVYQKDIVLSSDNVQVIYDTLNTFLEKVMEYYPLIRDRLKATLEAGR